MIILLFLLYIFAVDKTKMKLQTSHLLTEHESSVNR